MLLETLAFEMKNDALFDQQLGFIHSRSGANENVFSAIQAQDAEIGGL